MIVYGITTYYRKVCFWRKMTPVPGALMVVVQYYYNTNDFFTEIETLKKIFT